MAHFVSRLRFVRALAGRLIKPLPDPVLPFDSESGVHFYALGTSGSAPGVDSRQTSSYLLEVNGRRALIDAGTGLFMNYPRNRDPMEEIETVVLTHLHPDHVGDLEQFVVANIFASRGRIFAGTIPEERLYPRKKIIGPPGTSDFLLARLNAEHVGRVMDKVRAYETSSGPKNEAKRRESGYLISPEMLDEAFDFQELDHMDPAQAYAEDFHHEIPLFDEAATLRAYPVPHNDFQVPIPALGLRFEIGTAKQDKPVVVAFSGDTFEHPVLERICQDADLAIMDMAGEPVHLSSEQAASIAAASGVKVLAGTHLMPWDKYGPPSYHREQAEKHFPGRTEMLISGTTMSFDKGQFNKPMWIQTGQPVTEYERKTFERGCEPRLVQYVPRGAEHRASGQLPPDPTAARAAKTTRLAQLSSVIRPRF